jgi:hypothetical protein
MRFPEGAPPRPALRLRTQGAETDAIATTATRSIVRPTKLREQRSDGVSCAALIVQQRGTNVRPSRYTLVSFVEDPRRLRDDKDLGGCVDASTNPRRAAAFGRELASGVARDHTHHMRVARGIAGR